MQQEARAAARG